MDLIWETARPYFYLRTTPDRRLLLGGQDMPYATDHNRDQMINRKSRCSCSEQELWRVPLHINPR